MTSFVQGQPLTAAALNTAFSLYLPAGGVSTFSASLLSQSALSGWMAALSLPTASVGAANGLAVLNSSGQLPLSVLPAALQGAMSYQGVWNASTNSPALVSSTGTKGYLYKVTTAGTTTLDGVSTWNVGDMAVFNGSVWDKWDGISSEVLSVAGRTGAVTITSADLTDSTTLGRSLVSASSINAARVSLAVENLTTVADANATLAATKIMYCWTSITAARTAQLLAASSYNPGQIVVLEDWSGLSSPTLTITALANGTDTIVGSPVINSAFGKLILTTDGVSKWHAGQEPSIGTSAGQQIALNSAGKLPAVDGSNLFNVSANVSTVRQTVLSGPISAGAPTFLPATSASLSITTQNVSSTSPLIASAANGFGASGNVDVIGSSTANLTWTGLAASSTNFIWASTAGGALTPVTPTILPWIQQFGGTISVTAGQYTTDTSTYKTYLGNGTTATQVPHVIFGEVVTNATTVTSAVAYQYNGMYDSGYTNTLPNGGITVSRNTNLGVTPLNRKLILKNITSDANYAIGDEISEIGTGYGGNFNPITLINTRNTLGFINSGNWYVDNKSNGVPIALTLSCWAYRLIASRGW